jgi:hypothetical protein
MMCVQVRAQSNSSSSSSSQKNFLSPPINAHKELKMTVASDAVFFP